MVSTPPDARLLQSRLLELTAAWRDLDSASFGLMVTRLDQARQRGETVWIGGNGGSAANASHLALHLRQCGIKAHSLVAEVPLLTAIANDTDYALSFSRQILGLTTPGDVAVIISGSGDSPIILSLAQLAQDVGMDVIGLLGFGGGRALKEGLCDIALVLSSMNYAVVEDIHSALIHLLQESLQ